MVDRLGRWMLLGVFLAGCGAAADPAMAPVSPASGEDGWATLDWASRHEQMTFRVLPNLARRFQAFEQTPAPLLSCVTCHGEDAEQVGYRMPNGLPPLDPAAMPEGRTARFMRDVVTPYADRLMQRGGQTTCFTCHPGAGA